MEFTVHSIKDIESWLEIHRTTGMDIDLHFHIKRSPDIPGEDSLIDMPFKNTRGEEPFDWTKEKKTGRYVWKEDVTSEENTPDGFDYVGPNEGDVWKDYQNSASNGLSRLYRKYIGAPDIDKDSFYSARNEDLKKLLEKIFDAIKNRVDSVNNNFEPIDLSVRGSGQYYGTGRAFGIKEGAIHGAILKLEYEGIVFTANVSFDPLDPRVDAPNTLSHIESAEIRKGHSKYNVFKFTGPTIGINQPMIYIQMDREAFKQVYKEIMGDEYRD
ncbi:hypothetical protein SAMN02927921_03088 [Sinomicrobium oceani]|uniref:Uncharacterized protein n=1 Tax=Sinomicrobium oceani TaxID=1150368 RepID=A0A1K1R2Q7_9FLAO|nr:hypothetical protein [Sinomicrobium oceani]SFW66131.1 hypothetical protein SAMN02927921_03088 [Sinomicrobium oceani]